VIDRGRRHSPFTGDVMYSNSTAQQAEEIRILEAYRRRHAAGASSKYSYFNPGHLLNSQQLERCVLSSLQRMGCDSLEGKRILDVGCGKGDCLRDFVRWGSRPEDLFGIDLQPTRVAKAQRTLPSSVQVTCGNAVALDFPDETFDLVLQFTVFSSILNTDMKRQLAREMLRVVKRGAHIVWYDFYLNNPFNPDVRGIRKRELRDLFPCCHLKLHRLTLAPPLARRLGRISPAICDLALRSGVFSTHYLGLIEK
jgi:ubiquinone/menaquinone biosynthesis C-methylase UbiE